MHLSLVHGINLNKEIGIFHYIFFKPSFACVCLGDDSENLNFNECLNNIKQMIETSDRKREIHIDYSFKTTLESFKHDVVRYQPDFIHFIGHGPMILDSGLGYMDTNVDYQNIEYFLRAQPKITQCFILSSCDSYEFGQKLSKFIPYVICIKSDTFMQETAEFIKSFYRGLVYNFDIKISFNQAICEISEVTKNSMFLLNNQNNSHLGQSDLIPIKKDIKLEHQKKQGYLVNLKNLASVYENKGDHDSAISYYDQALELSDLLEDMNEKMLIFRSLASVYENRGDHDSAISYYDQALELSNLLGDNN